MIRREDVTAVGDWMVTTLSDINGVPILQGRIIIVSDDFFIPRGHSIEEWIQFNNPYIRTLYREGLLIRMQRIENQ